jgi:monoamine oxidase
LRALQFVAIGLLVLPRRVDAAQRARPLHAVVIGGGVAGLTAADELAKRGRSFVVLEGSHRRGGRVFTDPATGHDLGASLNHGSRGNRMTPVLAATGAHPQPLQRGYLFLYDEALGHSRPATPAERAEYARTVHDIDARLVAATRDGHDAPLGGLVADPSRWAELYARRLLLENGASNLEGLSAFDADRFRSGRDDRLVPYGRAIESQFAHVPVELGVPVAEVDYSRDPVVVRTEAGQTYRARHVISTVSTGILARSVGPAVIGQPPAHVMQFTPELPDWKQLAIRGLPMNHFEKVILSLDRTDFLRYGDAQLPANAMVAHQDRGGEVTVFLMRPFGRNEIIAFVRSDQQAQGVRAGLRHLFGQAVDTHVTGTQVTHWSVDPFTLGSYSYSRPRDLTTAHAPGEPRSPGEVRQGGKKSFHQLLYEPVASEDGVARLHFAGEAAGRSKALAARYNGSVAAAHYSGRDAARDVDRALQREERTPRHRARTHAR